MRLKKSIFIVTGETGSGKTLLISKLITEANKVDIKITGVYSPGKFENKVKTGIYLVDISSLEKKLLAKYHPGWDSDNPKREWKMNPEVLQWGDKVIQDSVPTNILIIDELGFLEFEKQSGWMSAFNILKDGDYRIAIVVIRLSLLNQALARWKNAKVVYMKDPFQYKEHLDFFMDQALAASIK